MIKYLIEEVVLDTGECPAAHREQHLGYCDTEEEARAFCAAGKTFTRKDAWSIIYPTPQFSYYAIRSLSLDSEAPVS